MSAASARAPRKAEGYLERSRSLAESFLAVAPLLALYEIGIAVSRSNTANGADVLLRRIFDLLGPVAGPLAWRVLLAVAFAAAAVEVLRRKYPIHRDLFILSVEGLAYGALLGPIAVFLQAKLTPFFAIGGMPDQGIFLNAVHSIGAGVYEELLFRLGLLSALFALFRLNSATLDSSSWLAAGAAVVVSAVVFSGFHHWPSGEPFVLSTFVFRSIAGVLLGVLFIFRGLGVAVYTHAAYDLLLVFR